MWLQRTSVSYGMDAFQGSKLPTAKTANEALTSYSSVLGLCLLLASAYSGQKLKMLNSLITAIDSVTNRVCYFILCLDKNTLKFSCDILMSSWSVIILVCKSLIPLLSLWLPSSCKSDTSFSPSKRLHKVDVVEHAPVRIELLWLHSHTWHSPSKTMQYWSRYLFLSMLSPFAL